MGTFPLGSAALWLLFCWPLSNMLQGAGQPTKSGGVPPNKAPPYSRTPGPHPLCWETERRQGKRHEFLPNILPKKQPRVDHRPQNSRRKHRGESGQRFLEHGELRPRERALSLGFDQSFTFGSSKVKTEKIRQAIEWRKSNTYTGLKNAEGICNKQ